MRALVAASLVVAMATQVQAGVLLPPKQYDHEPTVPYTITYVSQATIRDKCNLPYLLGMLAYQRAGRDPNDLYVYGCTDLDEHPARIYIWRDLRSYGGTWESDAIRHEKAHVNGWVHAD